MLTFNLDPTEYAAMQAYALANYSAVSDTYGYYEYYITTGAQGSGYINMGSDGGFDPSQGVDVTGNPSPDCNGHYSFNGIDDYGKNYYLRDAGSYELGWCQGLFRYTIRPIGDTAICGGLGLAEWLGLSSDEIGSYSSHAPGADGDASVAGTSGYYYYQKGVGSIRCWFFGGRYRCRPSNCCPCAGQYNCNPTVYPCNTCTGHDLPIMPPPPPPIGKLTPIDPIDVTPTPPPPTNPTGTLENNGGGVGDPHFEGFDRIFDFHGEPNKFYQIYKSDTLLINAKTMSAMHCPGTFIDALFVEGYRDGKYFECFYSLYGIADRWHVFESLDDDFDQNLVARTKAFRKEYDLGNYFTEDATLVKTDAGKIIFTRSKYLHQMHINFKFMPKYIDEKATGILGQTANMKLRLPNRLFEIPYMRAKETSTIITPEHFFPVLYQPIKTHKPPCFTCGDKLNTRDIFVDDVGQQWVSDEVATV